MYPKATRIYCLETRVSKFITPEQAKEYYHNGRTYTKGRVSCAMFRKKNETNTYIQPWAWLSFLRQPGEKNISAKLNDAAALDIFTRVNNPKSNADTVSALAIEYNVSKCSIRSIKNLSTWRHVTLPLIRPASAKPALVIAAKNTANKSTKISGSIAKFIARDNLLHKIPVKNLAVKYGLSKSSIRKIIAGKAWAEATKEILKELKRWTS